MILQSTFIQQRGRKNNNRQRATAGDDAARRFIQNLHKDEGLSLHCVGQCRGGFPTLQTDKSIKNSLILYDTAAGFSFSGLVFFYMTR